MIVICEECGKKYRINPGSIKGQTARFKCKACNHVIAVAKPAEPLSPIVTATPVTVETPSPPKVRTEKAYTSPAPSGKPRRLGLTPKFMLIVLVPFILIYAVSIFVSFRNMIRMHSTTIEEGRQLIMALAERTVLEKARAVAKQTGFFLSGQPNLTQKGFNRDLYFKKIVMQDLGLTGYTALYSIPDDRGISSLWVHPNAKLVGIDIKTKLSQSLGENFDRWWKVYQGAFDGKESKGYYQWREPDGRWVEKFMACAPIEGTPYIIAATTNVEEFTIPFLKIQKTATKIADQTKSANTISLSAGLLLIGSLIFFYGRGLTRKIRNLSSAADLISIGELDTQISIKSNDEIGDLAEAISRMQESIRLSIERLRRRK